MSVFDRFKRKRKSKSQLETRYGKLQKEKEELELEKEVKEKEREISRLKHPYRERMSKGTTRTGERISKFGGRFIKEGQRGYRELDYQMRRRRRYPSNIRLRSSFVSPDGTDISMSEGIARNEWSGERNIMNTDFFGNQQTKDLLGEGKQIGLIGNKEKKNTRYF